MELLADVSLRITWQYRGAFDLDHRHFRTTSQCPRRNPAASPVSFKGEGPAVYVISLSNTGHFYVGQTNDLHKRLQKHRNGATSVRASLVAESATGGRLGEGAALYTCYGSYVPSHLTSTDSGESVVAFRALRMNDLQHRLTLEGSVLLALTDRFPKGTVRNAQVVSLPK